MKLFYQRRKSRAKIRDRFHKTGKIVIEYLAIECDSFALRIKHDEMKRLELALFFSLKISHQCLNGINADAIFMVLFVVNNCLLKLQVKRMDQAQAAINCMFL